MKYTNNKNELYLFGTKLGKLDLLLEFTCKNNILKILIDILFFVNWFILTHITKLYEDDFTYELIFGTEDKISNIKDIFISQYNHYFMWGGRNIAHFFDQLFLMFDKIYFDLFNAAIFVLTCNIIYSIRKSKGENNFLLILIYISFWFFSGDLFRGVIWQTGSFNYLWMLCLSLIFIKFYFLNYDNKYKLKLDKISYILFVIVGFLAGWGHEIISPVVLTSIFIYLIWKKIKKIKIQNFEIVGLVAYFIGTVLLIAAPGNFRRIRVVSQYFNSYSSSIFLKYVIAILRNGYYFLFYEFPLFLLAVIIVFISYYYIRKNMRKVFIQNAVYYFFILFFSVFFYFIALGWAASNVMVQLIILDTIIVRFCHNIKIRQSIKILFIITFFIFIFYMLQFSTTVYYVVKDGKQIYHGIQLVR